MRSEGAAGEFGDVGGEGLAGDFDALGHRQVRAPQVGDLVGGHGRFEDVHTGGGEVARYVAKFGQPHGRVAKAVLVSSVPPLMLKTETNPGGTPIEVFDSFRKALADNRAQFYIDVASGPFYGFNREGAKISQGIIDNWWRQGMIGGALAHYEGIKAFSETDQTEDLKAITVPTLVTQGDDDQIVPYTDASMLQIKLLKHGTLKIYKGFPHGMLTTHADVINPDLLAFVKG